jgi:hypothetical protein
MEGGTKWRSLKDRRNDYAKTGEDHSKSCERKHRKAQGENAEKSGITEKRSQKNRSNIAKSRKEPGVEENSPEDRILYSSDYLRFLSFPASCHLRRF